MHVLALDELDNFQYSLRIVGFRDTVASPSRTALRNLSVFPANRGVPRPLTNLQVALEKKAFSIPCESWGSATGTTSPFHVDTFNFQYSLRIVGFRDQKQARLIPLPSLPFSIPCESWGSATDQNPFCPHQDTILSVFPANRGVPRPRSGRIHHNLLLLSVFPANRGVPRLKQTRCGGLYSATFSIPCESWGSATQVTVRICLVYNLSVFPANRGVPRRPGSDPPSTHY